MTNVASDDVNKPSLSDPIAGPSGTTGKYYLKSNINMI